MLSCHPTYSLSCVDTADHCHHCHQGQPLPQHVPVRHRLLSLVPTPTLHSKYHWHSNVLSPSGFSKWQSVNWSAASPGQCQVSAPVWVSTCVSSLLCPVRWPGHNQSHYSSAHCHTLLDIYIIDIHNMYYIMYEIDLTLFKRYYRPCRGIEFL